MKPTAIVGIFIGSVRAIGMTVASSVQSDAFPVSSTLEVVRTFAARSSCVVRNTLRGDIFAWLADQLESVVARALNSVCRSPNFLRNYVANLKTNRIIHMQSKQSITVKFSSVCHCSQS